MKNQKIFTKNIYKPTAEGTQASIDLIRECQRLGLPFDRFDNPNNSEETLAIALLLANKKIPADLEKRLLETKELRQSNSHTTEITENMCSDEDINRWLTKD